jgi:hypothetical protein
LSASKQDSFVSKRNSTNEQDLIPSTPEKLEKSASSLWKKVAFFDQKECKDTHKEGEKNDHVHEKKRLKRVSKETALELHHKLA